MPHDAELRTLPPTSLAGVLLSTRERDGQDEAHHGGTSGLLRAAEPLFGTLAVQRQSIAQRNRVHAWGQLNNMGWSTGAILTAAPTPYRQRQHNCQKPSSASSSRSPILQWTVELTVACLEGHQVAAMCPKAGVQKVVDKLGVQVGTTCMATTATTVLLETCFEDYA